MAKTIFRSMNQIKPIKVSLRRRRLYKGWSYYIDYNDPASGKRIRRSVGMDKEKAELRRSEIEWKLFKGDHGDIPSRVIESDLDVFLERYSDYAKQIHSVQTFRKDQLRLKPLIEFLRANGVDNFQAIDINIMQEFQTLYLKTHSRKSWNNVLMVIKAMLNRAIEWGIIEVNKLDRLKPLKIDKTFHYFTVPEIHKIIKAAPSPLKTAVIILVFTGIRLSELFNLRRRDVDLKAKKISIKPHGKYTTKSRKARAVPINDKLLKHLQGLNGKQEYVFRPYRRQNTISDQFKALLNELRLQGKLHDLRHTFASHLAMKGVPIPVICELLGHSDISTTMIYAHLSPDTHKDAIKKLPF